MTISIWRYSHLVLAITSSLFLFVAAITGAILAFEPISEASRPIAKTDLNKVSIAQTVAALDKKYDEILDIEVDANDFVIASVITLDGLNERIYVNPISGEKLGIPKEKSAFFQWTTNLHRSLFLKSTGRFFVGFISFLLCLITVTGFVLIAKRQGGIRKVFSKFQKDYFEQRYHVILGRWFILPIILVATTGVYLSAEKFSLLPADDLQHVSTGKAIASIPESKLKSLPIFENIVLGNVRSLIYPFSEAPEDYFELALTDRELYVDQYSGETLSEAKYPFVTLVSRFSLTLHTGQGSILWSIVLCITSLSLVFFMYSGFVMTLKRRKKIKPVVSQENKDNCEYILLVGSETGSTNDYATLFYNALTKAGKNVFKSDLNNYTTYDSAKHIIIFTATYGEGDAPTNARNFIKVFDAVRPRSNLSFSVLGFGSLVYPYYCKFAKDIDFLLEKNAFFKRLLPLYKVNNQSFEAFKDWSSEWSAANGVSLQINQLKKTIRPLKTKPFKVMDKSPLNDNTFLIRLRPANKIKFQSGDLLAYQPKEEEIPRLYSVARIQNDVLLSIKKHEFGICSNYFHQLSKNDTVNAAIQKNKAFRFPKHAKELVCIANGTGIAPFLGIIDENEKQIPIQLFWGGKTSTSFDPYREIIDSSLNAKKLTSVQLALSQEYQEKTYVQDLLQQEAESIAHKLQSGAVFMICGSVAMQKQVLSILEVIATDQLKTPLNEFENNGQLKMDCY
ncbi:oxidoreductase [Maribacter sp. MJ134]|uniref:PepSY domain-containing protein n=1 Tax=Maribacter sp. MJ134 TaxID=2496865 RepID=UPI000F817572|nr:PepSY domain-containing protein [Maribacter sp. MJ134]AZQ59432.1 oxidoreductase [Maribacter sp. MJ134]